MLAKPIEQMTSDEISTLLDAVVTIEDLVHITHEPIICAHTDLALWLAKDAQRMIASYWVTHVKHCVRCAAIYLEVQATYSYMPILISELDAPW